MLEKFRIERKQIPDAGTRSEKKTREKPTKLGAACLMPVALFAYYWTSRPFQDKLVEKHICLSDLNVQQRMNIELSASRLNATVIKPGEEFSFNRVLGPRTSARGYLKAPSYMEGETPGSFGGGI